MNIREIAKKADVSIATVSRVLNNSQSVSPTTRMHVLETLNHYGFQMDPWAKRLATKKKTIRIFAMISRRIKKMLEEGLEGFYSNVVSGIKDAAERTGISIEFVEMESNLSKDKLKNVSGVLLVGSDTTIKHVRFLKSIQVPLVLVDQYFPTVKVDCVLSNGYDGACYAISYLVSRGLHKIVHIHGFLNHFGFRSRYDGYITAMEENGLLPKTYEYNDEVMEDMDPLFSKMFSTFGVPEAIFSSNDTIAMKVIETLKDFRIKVPEDVSVIGFDGVEVRQKFNLPLTTLKVPMREMGSLALKRLLDIVYDQDVYPVRISLFTEFIKGASSI